MTAYRPPLEGRRGKLRLDFNENTTGYSDVYPLEDPTLFTTYPEYAALHQAVATAMGIAPEQLLLTNGSDEGIAVVASTLIEPKVDVALTTTPTFPIIPHCMRLAEAQIIEVPMTNALAYDVPTLTQAIATHQPKLVMLASPDNPTGAYLTPQVVQALCQQFPNTAFALDEAYGEFTGQTQLDNLTTCPNLLVLKTFSKAWGLAGLRLGLIAAHPSLIEAFRKVRSPYSINTVAAETALKLLPQKDRILAQAQATMATKQWVLQAVQDRGYSVIAGAANFFLLGVGMDAQLLSDFMTERNILIRSMSGRDHLWGWVRVSVGTENEMQALVAGLDAFREASALMFDLDDTLVDTSKSFDATIHQLVEQHTGVPIKPGELNALRAEGGFNGDWDATAELIRRRGKDVTREQIFDEGIPLYLQVAKDVEELYTSIPALERIKKRYRLLIATGRTRPEYAPVWGDVLDPIFEGVWCRYDIEGLRAKPHPDLIAHAAQMAGVRYARYVGNSVDDMQASNAAGFAAIGVTSNQSEATLKAAGAEKVFATVDDVLKYAYFLGD
jgi:histidinol-phosphate aminotransferase